MKYGIKGKEMEWFKSYLGGRKQFRTLNDHKSGIEKVVYGIPQGSCLGPLLFIMYFSDSESCLEFSKANMYADDAKENIEKSKERNKENYEKRHYATESNIKARDIVICLQKKRNKLTPKFNPERLTVISRKGTGHVAKSKYHIITRNVSHFKKVNRYETMEEENDYTDGEAKDVNSNIERDLQNCEEDQQARLRRSRRSRKPI